MYFIAAADVVGVAGLVVVPVVLVPVVPVVPGCSDRYVTMSHVLCFAILCQGVVFFAFWQGVVLQILAYFGIVHAGHWYKVTEVCERLCWYQLRCFVVVLPLSPV